MPANAGQQIDLFAAVRAEHMLQQIAECLIGIGIDRRDSVHHAVIAEQRRPVLLGDRRDHIRNNAVADRFVHHDDQIRILKRDQVKDAGAACLRQRAGMRIGIEAGVEHEHAVAAGMRLPHKCAHTFVDLRILDPGRTEREQRTVIQHQESPLSPECMEYTSAY